MEWYYLDAARQSQGPFDSARIIEWIQQGHLNADVLVAKAGWQQWNPASQVFAGQLRPAPAPAPPPTPAPSPSLAQPLGVGSAIQAIQVKCVAGPDAGKSFLVGPTELLLGRIAGIGTDDPGVGESHVTFSWVNHALHYRAVPGFQIAVNGLPSAGGSLALGQQFRIGASIWQVGDTPVGLGSLLDSIGRRINQLASTEKLEGFSLGEMFSEVFKKRSNEEVDEYFVCGTPKTTPDIKDVLTGWPKPWFFMRVLIFLAIIYAGFYITFGIFPNSNLIPGMIMMGALAMPLATVFLFFELNTPRNVSFHALLMLVCSGGVISLFVSLFGFSVAGLDWLGASQAGIVEETGKLLAVILIVRHVKYRYILNGLLFGAAVGAGFAAFESAGYAFRILLESRQIGAMTANIQIRAFLTPFGHVAWTAISAGALWRVKGDRPLTPAMLFNGRFLRAFLIPVVLHMTWNAPLPSPFFTRHLLLGVIGWYVVFGLVQQGLRQVRDLQLLQSKKELSHTQQMIAVATGQFPAYRPGA